MEVTVRLFAGLRERAGRERVAVELEPGATVADAKRALASIDGLTEVMALMPIVMAVNREYAPEETPLTEGDELALIPPVSGGERARVHVRVTEEPLSAESLSKLVSRPAAGAIVAFQGTTREVSRLDYEAYGEMAERKIATILEDCAAAHGLEAVAAEHRVGSVPLSETSVIVAASAAHRGEAFAGARDAIDRIKAEAPIWKKEVDGGEERWMEGTPPVADRLTHLGADGSARMVDVGEKPSTDRRARARALLRMSPATAAAVERGDAPKGDVLGTARIAGIQAAKRTAELIPLAHPLPLTLVDVRAAVDAHAGTVELEAEARTQSQTGVEMEAMTACSVAALTVYDMVKGLERGVSIDSVSLLEKTGGKRDWRAR